MQESEPSAEWMCSGFGIPQDLGVLAVFAQRAELAGAEGVLLEQ